MSNFMAMRPVGADLYADRQE